MGADTLHVLTLEWARLTIERTCTVKIEDQIRHFLRLAEDPGASASEREVAAARAEKLMAKYRIESLPDVDSPREDVQLIRVNIEGTNGSMRPAQVLGLATLAEALSCVAVERSFPRASLVMIAGTAGDLALLTELFNSALAQCKVSLKEALRGRYFRSQSERFHFRRSYTLGFFRGVANRVREAMKNEVLGTSKELVVVGRATRAERHIAELFPKTREGRTRMKFYRDEVSRGEGDGYRSGVGAPSPRGVGGDRVAIGG